MLVLFFRICGNTASDKNIHSSVSEQLKKNFAKSKWKVRRKHTQHNENEMLFHLHPISSLPS
jgi:hypothetical protein